MARGHRPGARDDRAAGEPVTSPWSKSGFDPDVHLRTVGVANQTTMLRGETEEVQRRIRQAVIDRDGPELAEKNFRFFDNRHVRRGVSSSA